MNDRRKVCVMGLGYIGLPTASLLGTKGFDVLGVDVSPAIVDSINRGHVHIVEPDLDVMVRAAVESKRLTASLEPEEADVFIIAVPTPLGPENEPDLGAVEAATRAIAPVVRPGNLVILESTSPVGTTDGVVARILREAGVAVGTGVHVAHCPERVLPGKILLELVQNDRVIGGIDPAATDAALEFYASFVQGECFATDSRTAEMVKLTENSYRDVNIAFANELSMICEEYDVSVWNLIQLANRHPRVDILRPGPGVGGHCIAVDPWFLVHGSPERARLIRTSREVNDSKRDWVIGQVEQAIEKLRDPVVACLGLAFKADVDDLRQSPAVEIVRELQEAGKAKLLIVEPHIEDHPEFELVSLETAMEQADVVLVLVDHRDFRRIPSEQLHRKILIDTRGLIP